MSEQVSYTTTRNVPATNEQGDPHLIALVLIKHPNGFTHTLAVNEEFIRFHQGDDPTGENVIRQEVMNAIANPVVLADADKFVRPH